MHTVTSKDGTKIAFDKIGQGAPVILAAGAFSFRKYTLSVELTELLAKHFTVINYDRRGRGDSGDTQPYAIEREFEDLDALIQHAGGSAYVWGMSSGAVLALRAANCGLNIKKLALYDPPFRIDHSEALPPPEFTQHVTDLIAQNKRGEAVRYFMTRGIGAPGWVVTMMRFMPGVWKRLTAVANTLPYDATLLDGYMTGKPLNPAEWSNVTMPTLVMYGGKGAMALQNGAKHVAGILPNAKLRNLETLSHTNVDMKIMAPAIAEFFNT